MMQSPCRKIWLQRKVALSSKEHFILGFLKGQIDFNRQRNVRRPKNNYVAVKVSDISREIEWSCYVYNGGRFELRSDTPYL
jgi:hypothetical protein